MLANTSITIDPSWPFSLPGLGLPALAGVAGVLALLTVWTYLGVRGVHKLFLILILRLSALLLACMLVLRPSLAQQDEDIALPSKLIVLIDKSASMSITDELNSISRWDHARELLKSEAVTASLKKLAAEQRVEVIYYQGAEDLDKFDPDGKADGKRTDMGRWLNDLWGLHGRESRLRGLVIIGDGADNGSRFPTLEKASLWRGACPITTFGVGKATTARNQNDIAFTGNLRVDPTPVHVKGKFTVTGTLDAPGFVGSRIKLSLLIDGQLVAVNGDITLHKIAGNEVRITADAPLKPGEIKVTLKVDPLQGEVTTLNNEISTYTTVVKEGVSILWVEGKKRLESAFVMREVLFRDRRFRVFPTERVREAKPAPGQEDWFQFDKRHYDVIVIGDISARRFAGGDTRLFRKIKELVEKKGTGLLMLGGYETFANSDWQDAGADLASLLPVDLTVPGQVETPVRMVPTEAGLQYLLRLSNNPKVNKDIWETQFEPLDGMCKLGRLKEGAVLLASTDGQGPIMAGRQVGQGRILAFAGDSTYHAWTHTNEAIAGYQRFWKQLMLWLAHQEEAEGNIRLALDSRRVAADSPRGLGFSVELVGKGGVEVKGARFHVKVTGPNQEEFEVPTAQENGKERGIVRFRKDPAPGEYKIIASAVGSREKPGEAKFLVFAEDVENLRPAADHDFLKKLAQAGRGKFYLADEPNLLHFLDDLVAQKTDTTKPRAQLWPDWRRNPASDSLGDQLETLWNSTALLCFLAFTGLLCVEWFLRRRWGMV